MAGGGPVTRAAEPGWPRPLARLDYECPDLVPVAANPAARRLLRAVDGARPPLTVAPRPDAEAVAAAPCSIVQRLETPGGPIFAAAHYQRSGRRLQVGLEPLTAHFALAAQLLDPLLVTDRSGALVFANQAADAAVDMALQTFLGRPALELGAALGLPPATVAGMLTDALVGQGSLDDFVAPGSGSRSRRFRIRSTPWRFCDQICGAIWVATEVAPAEARDTELLSAAWYRLAARYQHGLANTLQTLRAATDLGRMRDDGRNAPVFDSIERAVRNISAFIADRRQPAVPGASPWLLSHLVDEEIARARARRRTAGLRFDHRPPQGETAVLLPALAMGRVFANLFLNVAAARRDATVTIRYRLAGPRCTCSVSDDGPGFPPEMLRPDWLSEGDPRQQFGLAIVTATVEACGGSVSWGNRRPRGAYVVLELPGGAGERTGEVEAATPSNP